MQQKKNIIDEKTLAKCLQSYYLNIEFYRSSVCDLPPVLDIGILQEAPLGQFS